MFTPHLSQQLGPAHERIVFFKSELATGPLSIKYDHIRLCQAMLIIARNAGAASSSRYPIHQCSYISVLNSDASFVAPVTT